MEKRCKRNRKRSKRRAIYCPLHGCYLDSVSQKYSLYTNQVERLQQQGVGKLSALMLIKTQSTVILSNEWLEAFWCSHCQETKWYHVRNCGRTYEISVASRECWQQAIGVTHPEGNPSVGEFTRRHAKMANYGLIKQFNFLS